MTGKVEALQVKYPIIAPSKNLLNPPICLFEKWDSRIGDNWYGFETGGMPSVWTLIIDEFLTELEKYAPDFEIHQIKLKFGGLRFYIDTKLEDSSQIQRNISTEIAKLEQWLRHKDLIY